MPQPGGWPARRYMPVEKSLSRERGRSETGVYDGGADRIASSTDSPPGGLGQCQVPAGKRLASAGEGLVTTMVCSGCALQMVEAVRSVRNSSAGVRGVVEIEQMRFGGGETEPPLHRPACWGVLLSRSGAMAAAVAEPFDPRRSSCLGGRNRVDRHNLSWNWGARRAASCHQFRPSQCIVNSIMDSPCAARLAIPVIKFMYRGQSNSSRPQRSCDGAENIALDQATTEGAVCAAPAGRSRAWMLLNTGSSYRHERPFRFFRRFLHLLGACQHDPRISEAGAIAASASRLVRRAPAGRSPHPALPGSHPPCVLPGPWRFGYFVLRCRFRSLLASGG